MFSCCAQLRTLLKHHSCSDGRSQESGKFTKQQCLRFFRIFHYRRKQPSLKRHYALGVTQVFLHQSLRRCRHRSRSVRSQSEIQTVKLSRCSHIRASSLTGVYTQHALRQAKLRQFTSCTRKSSYSFRIWVEHSSPFSLDREV